MIRTLLVAIAVVILSSVNPAAADPDDDARNAITAMKRGDWNKAVELWGRAIDSGKLNKRKLVPAYGNRATSYSRLNRYIDALADYSRSLELASGSSYPPRYIAYNYSNRASVHIKLKHYGLAIQDADQAIKLNNQYHLGYFYRGRAKEMLGQRDGAIADFRSVLQRKPKHQSSLDALARLGAP